MQLFWTNYNVLYAKCAIVLRGMDELNLEKSCFYYPAKVKGQEKQLYRNKMIELTAK